MGDPVSVHDRDNESATDRAIRMARDQLGKAIEVMSPGPPSDLDAVVHQVRKRIKKVRALLKLLRGTVSRKSIAKADHRLRDASRPLSAVRDASALILTLDRLADRSAGLVPPEPFAEARSALVEQRDELTRVDLDEGQALVKALKAVQSVRRHLEGWEPGRGHSGPTPCFKRAYKQGREAFQAALEGPTADTLHELRKQVKALGYQLRTLQAEPGSPAARLENLSSLLADELGEGHDLDVLREFLAGRATSGPILGALDRRCLHLRQMAMQRAGVIFRDKPRAFARSVEAPARRVETVRSDG
jgi:CHAD domain-containing protein